MIGSLLAEPMLAVLLLPFTGLDEQIIEINPIEIILIREPRKTDHYHPSAKCLIFTVDGKFIPVRETCRRVREQLNGDRP